jgi:uncharacterized protein
MFVLDMKVVPSSGKQQCCLDRSGNLKCFLKNPAEKGKANKELIKFLSKKLKLEQCAINIIVGETSRKKRLKIDADVSFESICLKLGIELQTSIL